MKITLLVSMMAVAVSVTLFAGSADAQYMSSENDLRRQQSFGWCEKEFPSIKKMVTSLQHGVMNSANMGHCNKICMSENLSNHEKYMRCYGCCDTYYGQTDRVGTGERFLPPMQAGRYAFGAGWKGTTCRDISFKSAFPKSLNVNHIHLQVVVSNSGNTIASHNTIKTQDGLFTWVEWIKHGSFRACVSETSNHDGAHDASTRIDWMAWSNDEEYRGVTGTYKAPVSRQDVCKQVAFGLHGATHQHATSFVTTNHRNWGSTHDPIMTWVKETTKQSFTPCAREPSRNDDYHDAVEFDYATFARHVVCPGHFVIDSTEGKRHVRWASGHSNIRCQSITFPVGFPTTPIIMLTAHAQNSKGIAIWVESVNSSGFIACLQPRAGQPIPNLHQTYFDYIARTENANIDACMRGGCPLHKGHICGGQGQCSGGKCTCLFGRSGSACQN